MSNLPRAAACFAACLGFYLLLAGTLGPTEFGTGLAVSALVAAYSVIAHGGEHRIELPRPPLRTALRPIAALASDTIRVGLALLRSLRHSVSGQANWQEFHPGADAPRDAGRRALVALSTSLAPNGIVLDLTPSALPQASGALLVHRLVPSPPGTDADWPS